MLFFSLLLQGHFAAAQEQELTCIFVSPDKPLVAGSRGSVWLFCMNNSSHEIHRTFAPSIEGQITLESNIFPIVLSLRTDGNETEAVIAPGGFVKKEYLLDIPPAVQGRAWLEASNYNRLAILVQPGVAGSVVVSNPPPPKKTPSKEAFLNFFGERISHYEPIYFIVGTYPSTEFQFSLKFQLLTWTNQNWYAALVTNYYFAYTQVSYWDMLSSNPSFYDTSYKPSGFLYFQDVLRNAKAPFQLDVQGGFEHESNGRGGADERSMNTVYLQPWITLARNTNFSLTFLPRAWFYTSLSANNPDLPDYHGYADLITSLKLRGNKNWENFEVATKLTKGDDGGHTGLTLDFRYRCPEIDGLHFNPIIQVQYFTGYEQTLRQYNEYSHGLRAGLCLWSW